LPDVRGKKSVAERIVYGASTASRSVPARPDPGVSRRADQCAAAVEWVRRVGGATYQVPIEVRTDRSQALAIRWLIPVRASFENTMEERLRAIAPMPQ